MLQKTVENLLQEKKQKLYQVPGLNKHIQKALRLHTNAALDTEHLGVLLWCARMENGCLFIRPGYVGKSPVDILETHPLVLSILQ